MSVGVLVWERKEESASMLGAAKVGDEKLEDDTLAEEERTGDRRISETHP